MPNGTSSVTSDVHIIALEAWNLISARTRNCLGHRYVDEDPATTVASVPIEEMRLSHLSGLRAGDLLRIPNLGYSSYCEIALAMEHYGWRFRDAWGQKESPLAYFHPSTLARFTALAAAKRQVALERGETMRRLRDEDGMTLRKIGVRFNVSGTAVNVAIQHAGRIRDLRAHYPLPWLPVN